MELETESDVRGRLVVYETGRGGGGGGGGGEGCGERGGVSMLFPNDAVRGGD